jgi:predicted small lipoprotein YifL
VRVFLGSALLAAAVLALAGCGGGAKGPAPAQIVAAATKATSAERTFHFVYDEQHGPASKKGLHLIYAAGDVALPGKVEADVTGTLLGLPLRSTLVVVGGVYYIKNPFTGAWQTVSVATNPVAFFDPAKGVLAVISGATQLTSAGSEKVGENDAYRINGKVPVSAISPILGNPPSAKLVDVELWIDKQSSRLLRVRISGPVESGDPSNAVRTVDLSDYGKAVLITAPVKP